MRNGPIRILSVIEAEFITGAAKPLYEFARWSQQSEVEQRVVQQTIVTYRRGQEPENAFIQTVREAGIFLEVLEERGRFDTQTPSRLRQLVAHHKPDIVETNNIKSHMFARLSGVWRERPWVAFHHGFTAEDAKMRLYNLTSRWSLRTAHRVVTVCGAFRDQLAGRGIARDRIRVMHNPVAPFSPASDSAMAAARARIPAQPGIPVLFSAGRLSREKGHADLLEAMAHLRRTGTKVHLAIAGEGPERERLQTNLRRLELEDRVTLLGLEKDIRPFYMLADAVVMPSHSEGSPNVLLEAMAAGCAIVATRVGGIPEIVEHESSALLVAAREPVAMSQAVSRILDDIPLRQRLASQARQVAATRFTLESYARERVRLYLEILDGEPGGAT